MCFDISICYFVFLFIIILVFVIFKPQLILLKLVPKATCLIFRFIKHLTYHQYYFSILIYFTLFINIVY